MTNRMHELLKQIPKVDRILDLPEIITFLETYPRPEVLTAVRTTLDRLRGDVRRGICDEPIALTSIAATVGGLLRKRGTHSLRPLINGTGVVVHTNLGRSPLADEAEEAMRSVACGYSNLEFDLHTGERGTRYVHVEQLICELTGAEAALVVNNNAAAVILALSAIAQGRDVVVSRGELVEIGGSFRIPDVMRQSGANLVEVGTTNRTHIRDFLTAITDTTALFLKVHTSNFAIVGFTAEAAAAEMAALGSETGVPVMVDAGSGCLVDLSPYGICGEPVVRSYLESGVDVVTFSGDKLLGGPQAGLIVGKRSIVEPMKRHPLLRALRMDKLSLAALEATLRLYRDERQALRSIPTLRMLTLSAEELARRANRMVRMLRSRIPVGVALLRHPGESSAGGGAYPLLRLPTTLLEVRVDGSTPQQIDEALRAVRTPVIGRIHRDRFLLDVRTILDRDIPVLAESLHEAFHRT